MDHVLGDEYSANDRIEFALYAFLAITPDGRHVLVDLGPIGLDYINDMFRRFKFFRPLPGDPDAIRQPYGNVFDHLGRLGVRPEQITDVVLTHMHADHHGLFDGRGAGAIERLPRAVLHVSAIGWQDNVQRRQNGCWNSYVDYAFADYIEAGLRTGRVVAHDDDALCDGIDVTYHGGHSVCSQVVSVRTSDGVAIITGDEVYRYDVLEQGCVPRLYTSPERICASVERIVRRVEQDDAIVIPCHDPLLADWYAGSGDAWLAAARERSRQAVRGYRRVGAVRIPGASAVG